MKEEKIKKKEEKSSMVLKFLIQLSMT